MRYGNDGMSRVLNKLNESHSQIEMEPTVGTDTPEGIKQCKCCSGFYTGNPATCPVCGGPLETSDMSTAINEARKARKRRQRLHEDTVINIEDPTKDDDDAIIAENNRDEVLPDDAQVAVNEAMKMLSKGQCKKFNESCHAKVMKNGRLNILVESANGRTYSVVRKMNAIQKANFRLSESMKTPKTGRAATANRLKATQSARTNLAALTEMRAVKVAALKLMERQGVTYDYAKFNKMMNESIATAHGRFKKKFEGISDDNKTGLVDFESSTPEEVSADVTEIIEDTGLQVVTQAVEETTPETTEVMVRVQDDPDVEVNLQDVAETVADVTAAPVAVVGPTPVEGDSTLSDVVVILNPDDETVDELADETVAPETPVALSESLRARVAKKRLHESCDDDVKKDPKDPKDPKDLTEDEDMKGDPNKDDDDDLPKLSERRSVRRGLRKLREAEDLTDDNNNKKPVKDFDDDDDKDEDDKKTLVEKFRARRARRLNEATNSEMLDVILKNIDIDTDAAKIADDVDAAIADLYSDDVDSIDTMTDEEYTEHLNNDLPDDIVAEIVDYYNSHEA